MQLWIPSDGKEPDKTECDHDVATNEAKEEWAYVEEQQVVEQAPEESQICAGMRCSTAAKWLPERPLRHATKGERPEEWCTSSTLGRRRGR